MLRPTPARVRETLFNWLQPVIAGAECLDLFAGTGALGFEAVSRGAANSVLLEHHPGMVEILEEQIAVFKTTDIEIIRTNAQQWLLAPASKQFDIVFVDPPFRSDLYDTVCELLVNNGYLRQHAWVYVESQPGILIENERLKQIKRGRAGQVQYQLLEYDIR